MVISNKQLETWAHQGSITASKSSHESIRACLSKYYFPEGVTYDDYLQGSYRNSTNIFGDSDVDLVVELTSAYRYNIDKLTQEENKKFLERSNSEYSLFDFKKDILNALRENYDNSNIEEGSKSIKLKKDSVSIDTDIVVSMKYRYFFSLDNYVEGISFYSNKDYRWIYSYPKQHYDNGLVKMSNTDGNYKPFIRICKNIRSTLEEDGYISDNLINSYQIESLIFNVPNNLFSGTYQEIFYKIFSHLERADISKYQCQHELYSLFGDSLDQWNIDDAKKFINKVIKLWDDWE